MKWVSSSEFVNIVQYLVMKGKKLLKQGTIGQDLSDTEIWGELKVQFPQEHL